VTKLIIYRGETRQSEVPLTGKTMRIGRSADNDVVLEDPGKGVSRAHAELRLEGDRYRLVDLSSQNGIWVSGKRVPSVLLTPGVVAAMGPYRVAIDAASPLTQPFTPIKEEIPDTGTELLSRAAVPPPDAPLPPPPVPPSPAPVAVVDGPGALLDSTAPAAATAKPAKAKPSTTATVKPAAAGGGSAKMLAAGIAALVLIAASGFGAYKWVQHKRQPVWDATVATALVNGGKCQEALDTQINRALQANPNDAQALSLKQRCATPPPVELPKETVPAPVEPPKTNAQILDEAEASIGANACQSALDAINGVLAQEANDERAKTLQMKANECLNPAPAPRPGPAQEPVAVRMPPADGGLDPLPGEKDKDYKARVTKMKSRYSDAVALVQNQKYTDAIKELDAIDKLVPQGYMDLSQQRATAQTAIRNDAKAIYNNGRQAEARQSWNVAIQLFQRAHDVDPTINVAADVERIKEQKAKLGQQACADGRAAFALGHTAEAKTAFEKVIELLPQSDPCYAIAQTSLQKLR
jgi:predicted component of type VI protein secretion system